eukprot:gene571-716_t
MIGAGWGFPPSFDRYSKSVEIVQDEIDIQQSLRVLFGTTPGERIMELDFGCDLSPLAFQRLDLNLKTFMINNIKDAIARCEPRIHAQEIRIDMEDHLEGLVKIHITVSYTTSTTHLLDLDYPFLKQQGIHYIQQLAGRIWNDYNEHDPGITILEVLCYAIIDLEYRTNFYIEDLLAADPDEPEEATRKNFYVAEEILPCNALTRLDFLKLILDVNGVKNAKVFLSQAPQIQGGYKILLDLEDRIIQKGQEEEVIEAVKNKLYSYRNLCEDFFSIERLSPLHININAALELHDSLTQEEGELLREMLFEKQKTVEEIFLGPLLDHGFIDDEELMQNMLQPQIYISEILKKVTDIKQIKSVKKFTVTLDGQTDVSSKMSIDIPLHHVPKISIDQSQITLYHKGVPLPVDWNQVKRWTEENMNALLLKRPYLAEEEIAIDSGRFRSLSEHISIQNDFPLVYGIGPEGLPNEIPEGRKVQASQLKAYLMFFDQVFANYLSQLANVKELLAVQKQEEALDFSKIPQSVPLLHTLIKKPLDDKEQTTDRSFQVQRRYLGMSWQATHNNDDVTTSEVETAYKQYLGKTMELLNTDQFPAGNNILDHLLARFSETFTERAMQLYDLAYASCLHEVEQDKTLFLKDYIVISRDRNRALDLTNNPYDGWDVEHISGFERRMCRALGIKNLKRRSLHEGLKSNFYLEQNFEQQSFEIFLSENLQDKYSNLLVFKGNYANMKDLAIRCGGKESNYHITENAEGGYDIALYVDRKKEKYINMLHKATPIVTFEQAQEVMKQAIHFFETFNKESEGFHLVEHIMLRTDDELSGTHDPYSFLMTLVFPSWPMRFQREEFKNLIHEFVLQESPAHLFVNILWLDLREMEMFEQAYKEWLFYRTTTDVNDPRLKEAARHLLGIIMLYAKGQDY